MRQASSAQDPTAERAAAAPRVYADANLPSGVVAHMRDRLGWDVVYAIEQPALRAARDAEHFALARRLRRTLVTLDRDYLDARRFDPRQGAGVLVLAASDARGLVAALTDLDRTLFRGADAESSDLLLDPVRAECARRVPPAQAQRLSIGVATRGAEAVAIGAARLAARPHA